MTEYGNGDYRSRRVENDISEIKGALNMLSTGLSTFQMAVVERYVTKAEFKDTMAGLRWIVGLSVLTCGASLAALVTVVVRSFEHAV